MSDLKDVFHKVSYLQYPLMVVAVYFSILPYIEGFDTIWQHYNNMLIFAGLGISFSTLQDTTKTQNDFSKRVWEDPKKGKLVLILLSSLTFFMIIIGSYGYFFTQDSALSEMAFGTIILAIGFIGLIKAALEMFENHRLDKKTDSIS